MRVSGEPALRSSPPTGADHRCSRCLLYTSGLTQNAGTSGVAEKNLNRWTVIIALVWVALIIGLDMMTKFNLG